MDSLQLFNDEKNSWIENLALEELNMDESGIINFNEHLDPTLFLEESSINFMNQLRDIVELYVTKFNEYRGLNQKESQIKIFKIANTVNDFMLYRNSLRLIFNRKTNDTISIGFLASSGELLPARINFNGDQAEIHEIKAHVGPFNNISWKFQQEPVEIDSLARHYLTEFIRNSAR